MPKSIKCFHLEAPFWIKKCFTSGNIFLISSVISCIHGISTNKSVDKKKKVHQIHGFVQICTHQLICIYVTSHPKK